MAHVSTFNKGRAVGMLEAGLSIHEVSRLLNHDRKTIRRWWNKFQATGNCERRQGSGRPRKGTNRDDRLLVCNVVANRFSPVSRLVRQTFLPGQHPYSIRTAQRRVLERGYRSCRPVCRIPLGPNHKTARFNWCNEHVAKEMDFWKRVLWTDESRFALDFHDGRVRVRRLRSERFHPSCIAQHDRYGGGSIMIWGGIWYDGKTEAVLVHGTLNGERYVNEIVIPHVVPCAAAHALVLQQDNARPHTSNVTRAALNENQVAILSWPARSPDLSPIEHIWDVIQRSISENYDPATSLQQLAQQVTASWNQVSQQIIQHLIESVPRRLQECVDRRGNHTRY